MTIRDTIAQAARSLVIGLTGLSSGKVILAEQSSTVGPRPAKPYITVKVGAIPEYGVDEVQDKWTTGTTLVRHQRGYRRASISLNGFGAGADDYLEMVRTGLQLPAAVTVRNSTNVSFANPGTILNLTDMLDTSYEQQFAFDLEAAYIQDNTANLDIAATVTVSGSLLGDDDPLSIPITVTP